MNRIKVTTEELTDQLSVLSRVAHQCNLNGLSVQLAVARLRENRAGFVPAVNHRLDEIKASLGICVETTNKLKHTLEQIAEEYAHCENLCAGETETGLSDASGGESSSDSSDSWYHSRASSEDGNHWIETTVGKCSGSFETHLNLLTDGALIDAGFDAAVGFVLFQTSGESSGGNTLLGYDANVNAVIGRVEGTATGKLQIDEDGLDAYLEGSAVANIAEGSASVTFHFLGLEITGTAKGYIGAGAEGEIGIKDNKVVVGGSVAAGLGGGLYLEIGLSDEISQVIEDVRNFIDFITFWD